MFEALTASSSRKSKLNRAIAAASEDRDIVAGPSVEIELEPATVCVDSVAAPERQDNQVISRSVRS